jgi:regulator of protease activity HflC (stomatin/prohibitin superfamily)
MKVLAERRISVERPARTMSGLPIMALIIATVVAVPFILMDGIRMGEWASVVGAVVVLGAMAVVWRGFFTLEPNEACVLMSSGEYDGTVREPGFHWTNPFARKKPVSLRAQSLCIEKLKVHNGEGEPVEFAAVVVWRVTDTARAVLDVHSAGDFVRDQCGNAVRHMISNLVEPADESPAVLRRGVGQIQEHLRSELQERVIRAGVTVDEVRVTQRCESWKPSVLAAVGHA